MKGCNSVVQNDHILVDEEINNGAQWIEHESVAFVGPTCSI